MWLLPTRNRISSLRRFLTSAREMGTMSPGRILVDDDDFQEHRSAYETAMALAPEQWKIEVLKNSEKCYGGALREIWRFVKDLPWIGLVSDDLVPSSGNWDTKLIGSLSGWNVVSSNDGWQATTGDTARDRLHGAIVWSGDLARAVGWIFPDRLKHIFHDDIWETIGRETGCWSIRTDIMCKHLHESLSGVRGPTMDPSSLLWKHDEAIFKGWMERDKDACVARVRELMDSRGVRVVRTDFSSVKLMIGTPCIDGKFEDAYVDGLLRTTQMMQRAGVTIVWAKEKYTADIALARNKIFGQFLRSDCTHLLTIDADIGWKDDAVVRLFNAKKDFVAIAGPKKRYPLQFAANWSDDKGNPKLLQYDNESGTMEVGEIGSAFALITRTCALKMAAAYSELEFIGPSGELDIGVFNPMIENRRYYSEDFAFCKRWRAISGHVHFVPDVALSHTGSHEFCGAFADSAKQAEAEKAA